MTCYTFRSVSQSPISLLLSADKLASLSTKKVEAAQTNFCSHNHCIYHLMHLNTWNLVSSVTLVISSCSQLMPALPQILQIPSPLIYTSASLKPLPALSPWSSVFFFPTGSWLALHKYARISYAIPLIPVNNKKNPHWTPHPTSATAPFSCSHVQQKY